MSSSKKKDVNPWLLNVLDLFKAKQLIITWDTQRDEEVKVPLLGSHRLLELITTMLV